MIVTFTLSHKVNHSAIFHHGEWIPIASSTGWPIISHRRLMRSFIYKPYSLGNSHAGIMNAVDSFSSPGWVLTRPEISRDKSFRHIRQGLRTQNVFDIYRWLIYPHFMFLLNAIILLIFLPSMIIHLIVLVMGRLEVTAFKHTQSLFNASCNSLGISGRIIDYTPYKTVDVITYSCTNLIYIMCV